MKLLVSISFLSIDLLYFYAPVFLEDHLQLIFTCCQIQCLLNSFGVVLDFKNSFHFSISFFFTSTRSVVMMFSSAIGLISLFHYYTIRGTLIEPEINVLQSKDVRIFSFRSMVYTSASFLYSNAQRCANIRKAVDPEFVNPRNNP
jgi:hypothetical protein